jgi:uncharacterized protein YecT (DUF1311 family)
MKYMLTIFFFFFKSLSYSQTNDGPVEMTPEIKKQIKLEIDLEAIKFKQTLKAKKENNTQIEFMTDTFRVEELMSKWIELDYRDFAMKEATYEAADLYDSLLNKYFKKLLAVLKGNDKKILTEAQKAWISFRDNEGRLTEIISKDEYSGGGTIQSLLNASIYLNLVKDRTITLFQYYARATQAE